MAEVANSKLAPASPPKKIQFSPKTQNDPKLARLLADYEELQDDLRQLKKVDPQDTEIGPKTTELQAKKSELQAKGYNVSQLNANNAPKPAPSPAPKKGLLKKAKPAEEPAKPEGKPEGKPEDKPEDKPEGKPEGDKNTPKKSPARVKVNRPFGAIKRARSDIDYCGTRPADAPRPLPTPVAGKKFYIDKTTMPYSWATIDDGLKSCGSAQAQPEPNPPPPDAKPQPPVAKPQPPVVKPQPPGAKPQPPLINPPPASSESAASIASAAEEERKKLVAASEAERKKIEDAAAAAAKAIDDKSKAAAEEARIRAAAASASAAPRTPDVLGGPGVPPSANPTPVATPVSSDTSSQSQSAGKPGEDGGPKDIRLMGRTYTIYYDQGSKDRRRAYFTQGQGSLEQPEEDILSNYGITGDARKSVMMFLPEFFDALPSCTGTTQLLVNRRCEVAYYVLWSVLLKARQETQKVIDDNKKKDKLLDKDTYQMEERLRAFSGIKSSSGTSAELKAIAELRDMDHTEHMEIEDMIKSLDAKLTHTETAIEGMKKECCANGKAVGGGGLSEMERLFVKNSE
jgi:hypothetical protein